MGIATYLALFGAGLLTFASPCVLPLLPMYLAVLGGSQMGVAGSDRNASTTARRRLERAGLGFALGLAAVFVALGMGASAIAATLAGHRRLFEVGAGLLMLVLAIKLLGFVRLPWLDRESRPLLQRVPSIGGFSGGLLFGVAFAVGWTPCVGPILGAALTYAASATANPLIAGSLLAAYALGLAAPLVAASFAASRLLVLTGRLRSYTPTIQRVTGAAMFVVGALLVTSKLSLLTPTAMTEPCAAEAVACETPNGSAQPNDKKPLSLPHGPALVEFVSGNCTVCKKMHPIVTELEHQCAAGLITRVSVDDARGRSLAAHYGVSLVPTFVSIDAKGGEVERIVGEQPRQRLILALNEIRGAPCEAEL